MSSHPSPDDSPPGATDPRVLFTIGAVFLTAAAVTLILTGAFETRPSTTAAPTPTMAPVQPTAPAPAAASTPAEDTGHGSLPDDIELSVITPADAAARLTDNLVLFVDMRESTEYTAGHIPGALGLFSDELQSRLAAMTDGSIIVAYSDASRPDAGRRGAAILLQLGYEKVFLLDGGLEAWRSAGLPLATP